MLSEREQLEHDLLAIIRDSSQPMGCGNLRQLLVSRGHTISEATVGRFLRELDNLDYTDKAGFRGRLLSEKGEARLSELENKERSLQWGAEFSNSLRGHTKGQLLEILVARRAIESELAYLAAENRTDEEARQLQAVLAQQRQALAEGGTAAAEDVDFHACISRAARNRVLGSAIALIRQDTQLSPVLEYIRQHVKSMVYIDHQRVADAITARQPDAARQAMIEHINSLIRDVEKYWKLYDSQK